MLLFVINTDNIFVIMHGTCMTFNVSSPHSRVEESYSTPQPLLLLLLLLLLLQLIFLSVAVVLTPVQTKQIRINIHKRNNT